MKQDKKPISALKPPKIMPKMNQAFKNRMNYVKDPFFYK
jgi:hypothetical protein